MEFLFKYIYLFGIWFQNRQIFSVWRQLRFSEFHSDAELSDLQNSRLTKLLDHAKNSTSYYAYSFRDIDIKDIDISNISELPILKKSDLRENQSQCSSDRFKIKNCILSETSGTSGHPFIFYRDKSWDASHRAAIYRGLKSHGVSPWEKSLYVWGFIFTPFNKIKTRTLDFIQNRFRIFQFDDVSLKKAERKLPSCIYIEGYSSVLNALSVSILSNDRCFHNIQMVKATSEKIYGDYEENIKQAFGCKVVSEYGSAETGIIAFSCPQGVMHVIRENVILEVEDNRAIVTNLHSFSMPIIRYELGDYIEVQDNYKCNCGRHGQVVLSISGRVGSNIKGQRKTFPSLTLYYIFKDLAISESIKLSYQGVQDVSGQLIINIFSDIPDEKKSIISGKILLICDKYFKQDVSCSVQFVRLDINTSKLVDFVSNLDNQF